MVTVLRTTHPPQPLGLPFVNWDQVHMHTADMLHFSALPRPRAPDTPADQHRRGETREDTTDMARRVGHGSAAYEGSVQVPLVC